MEANGRCPTLASEAVESPGPSERWQLLFFFSGRFNTFTLQLCTNNLDLNSIIHTAMGQQMKNLKKRKLVAAPKVEEINFDSANREEWLTGFHKRKVQRAKHAAENAAKQYKEDKKAMRKKVRPSMVLAKRYLLTCLDSRGAQKRFRTSNGRACSSTPAHERRCW